MGGSSSDRKGACLRGLGVVDYGDVKWKATKGKYIKIKIIGLIILNNNTILKMEKEWNLPHIESIIQYIMMYIHNVCHMF